MLVASTADGGHRQVKKSSIQSGDVSVKTKRRQREVCGIVFDCIDIVDMRIANVIMRRTLDDMIEQIEVAAADGGAQMVFVVGTTTINRELAYRFFRRRGYSIIPGRTMASPPSYYRIIPIKEFVHA